MNDGIEFDGNSDFNYLYGNTSKNNGTEGFDSAVEADNNYIGFNRMNGNDDEGFNIKGDDNKIVGNTARFNGDNGEAGIRVTGESNLLTLNRANFNDGDGICAEVPPNIAFFNVAFGNGGANRNFTGPCP